jgi:hypothetical protein
VFEHLTTERYRYEAPMMGATPFATEACYVPKFRGNHLGLVASVAILGGIALVARYNRSLILRFFVIQIGFRVASLGIVPITTSRSRTTAREDHSERPGGSFNSR